MISDELEKTLQRAKVCAETFQHEFMTIEHLLFSMIEDIDVKEIFTACDVDSESLKKELEIFLKEKLSDLVNLQLEEVKPTLGFQRVIQRAVIHVQSSGKEEATAANVLVSIFSERESHAVYFLQKQSLNRLDVVDFISHGQKKEENFSYIDQKENEEILTKSEGDSQSFLDKYCINLNKKAENDEIDPVIGRDNEILRAIHILSRRNKNNPIFVGDPGVGKTALAEGLALKIFKKEVPVSLMNSTIYSLDLGGLLAGTRFRGDFEERLKKLMSFFESKNDNILFIDEIHTIIGAGGTNSGSIDASNILKPALTKGSFKCIGSTTYTEYRNYFEKDRALCRRFQKIDVEEPSFEDSISILKGVKKFYEEFHSVEFDDDCFSEAVSLSKKYLLNSKLPDKAIDLIDETAASVKINLKKKIKKVGIHDIQETISKIANIPENTIKSDERIKLNNLERDLKTLIFGQDKAVNALSSAIKLSKTGLRNQDKTIGSFLFTGPTGVGKTELAKQLANIMKINFIRFDMSEYMERHSVSKLIGAPPGYVGYDQGGQLTDAIDKSPFSVILLDEIEKAHPDVFNILLQIMDYGRLTDHMGKRIDFTNVILIMTSNVGANELIKEKVGFLANFSSNDNEKEINSFFSPEFRNRLDAIINFDKLRKKESIKIVDKFLMELESQIVDKDLTLNVTTSAKNRIQELGFDVINGARPMARVIQEKIKIPLSEILLKTKKPSGTIDIDYNSKSEEFSIKITSHKSKIKLSS
ncbi:MAG: ATP-dependent Clp protease ATP-binding subunit ClpA [Rickettsiales bacterium]|nr:ATP-dependent Clp protease ATP-binding subunit ClpA [Rickettsiales bacterium]